jgi:hypothetical protein
MKALASASSRLSAVAAAARSVVARAARARFSFCLLSFMLTFLCDVAPALGRGGGGGGGPRASGRAPCDFFLKTWGLY